MPNPTGAKDPGDTDNGLLLIWIEKNVTGESKDKFHWNVSTDECWLIAHLTYYLQKLCNFQT